jgi:hypothetical protein
MEHINLESLKEPANLSGLHNDEYVTAKDLKIAFFEFTRDVLNPKFIEIDNRFNDLIKTVHGLSIKLNLFILVMVPVTLGCFGYIFKILLEISARLPK